MQIFIILNMNYRNFIKTPITVPQPRKLLIDTHGGLQDILAIVAAHKIIQLLGTDQQIIGITCVAGKNSLQDAVKSAKVANKLLGTAIPIFKGQTQGIMLQDTYPKAYLQQKFTSIEQKLFSLVEGDQALDNLVHSEKAVDFITRSCQKYQKQLSIVAFGPATNLGLAHRLENCLEHILSLSLTGGQFMGIGNTVTGNVQANFAYDPTAAHILFSRRGEESMLTNKIFLNVLERSLDFSWKLALNTCIDSGNLDPLLEDIFANMLGINSIMLNIAPLLTILPLIQPKTVLNKYHAYGEIIRDAGSIDGLLAINWLKVGAKPGEYQNFFFIYEDYYKQLIDSLFVKAFTAKSVQKVSE